MHMQQMIVVEILLVFGILKLVDFVLLKQVQIVHLLEHVQLHTHLNYLVNHQPHHQQVLNHQQVQVINHHFGRQLLYRAQVQLHSLHLNQLQVQLIHP